MPIVSAAASVRCRGSSGYACGVRPIERTRNECERRLRDEELRDALEVAQHLAALGDERRHAREVAADEHEVGDGARHLRAVALRDREPRRLQRGHVVHAVADHRDVAAVGGERFDDALLVLRRDPADHRSARRAGGAARPGRAAGRARRRARRPRCPRPPRRRPTVSGRSPERTVMRTPCARRNSTVSRASSRSRSPSTTSAEQPARSRGVASASTAPRAMPNATTRRPDRASSSASACRLAEREQLGRAEHVRRRRRAATRSSAASTRTARSRAAPRRRRAAVLVDRGERRVPRRARSAA